MLTPLQFTLFPKEPYEIHYTHSATKNLPEHEMIICVLAFQIEGYIQSLSGDKRVKNIRVIPRQPNPVNHETENKI